MRHIEIPHTTTLPGRWKMTADKRAAALARIILQNERSIFLKKKTTWTKLKTWLAGFSNYKCWYCEAKCLRACLDVDHFRPKLAVTVNRVVIINCNGYYWLAYDWTNFRLTCQRCNRPEEDELKILRGKANEFPLQDEAQRCLPPSVKLDQECPMLLDPCMEADVELLAHGLDGEVKPSAPDGSWEYERARYTIDTLGLNSFTVPEHKRETWQTLLSLINAVSSGYPSSEVKPVLEKYISPEHEYSSFFRSVIGTHRTKPWIEDLLLSA